METKHTYRDALQNRMEQADKLFNGLSISENHRLNDYKAVIHDTNLALGTQYTEDTAYAWSCARIRDNGAKARPQEVVQSIRSGYARPKEAWREFGYATVNIQHCAGIQDGETYYAFEVWPNDPPNHA